VHALTILHQCLDTLLTCVHRRRRETLFAAVTACVSGPRLTSWVTSWGSSLAIQHFCAKTGVGARPPLHIPRASSRLPSLGPGSHIAGESHVLESTDEILKETIDAVLAAAQAGDLSMRAACSLLHWNCPVSRHNACVRAPRWPRAHRRGCCRRFGLGR
jgi:hypothetical protein